MTTGVKMGAAQIGPASWRNNTQKELKQAQDIVRSSDRACLLARSMDPVPHLREILAELSNDEAHRYFRQTRAVVYLLRESLIETNEEIKALTRGKEALEKSLEFIRKDMKLNKDCEALRTSRPVREKDHDGADDLLQAERMHLWGLKRMLEQQLQLVQQQLHVLDQSRQRLAAVVQERTRVLDLICAAIPAGGVSASAMASSRTPRLFKACTSAQAADMNVSNEARMAIDPLGPYTPEADAALNEAKDARERSIMLRRNLKNIIDRVLKTQEKAHNSVNDGFNGKIAETVGLSQNLELAKGENRHALHRAQRTFNSTELAWNFTKGPLSSSYLSSHERLDRPIIKVFQRHPGTNLPEAQEIIRGGDGLVNSLRRTGRNIGNLRLAQLRLSSDLRDKKAAIDVDSSILRLRRQKSNHRWVLDNNHVKF